MIYLHGVGERGRTVDMPPYAYGEDDDGKGKPITFWHENGKIVAYRHIDGQQFECTWQEAEERLQALIQGMVNLERNPEKYHENVRKLHTFIEEFKRYILIPCKEYHAAGNHLIVKPFYMGG